MLRPLLEKQHDLNVGKSGYEEEVFCEKLSSRYAGRTKIEWNDSKQSEWWKACIGFKDILWFVGVGSKYEKFLFWMVYKNRYVLGADTIERFIRYSTAQLWWIFEAIFI